MGKSRQGDSKGILKEWISFEVYCNLTSIRAGKACSHTALRRPMLLQEKGLWEIYSLLFCAAELSHYVAAVLINFTWLSTQSPSNNSPLLFGSDFLISDSWCFNTVGQCCKYSCIKIHPKSNKRSTIKPLFGIFQHYILKKTPNHPHEVVRKGPAYALQERRLSQWKGGSTRSYE